MILKSVINKTVELRQQNLTYKVLFPDKECSTTEPAQSVWSIFENEMWKGRNIEMDQKSEEDYNVQWSAIIIIPVKKSIW